MSEEITRREAMQRGATTLGATFWSLIGGAGAAGFLGLEKEEKKPLSGGYDPTKHEWFFLFDVAKCIGCGSCVRACEKENDVPEGFFRTWIERYQVSPTGECTIDSPNGGHGGFGPSTVDHEVSRGFFVPKTCNHCRNSPCVQLCPVGASYKTQDGVVLVDWKRCIGCGYCVQACPFGSRFIHPVTHIATKCTFCYHRITKGLRPACVEICPTTARKFGDRKNPDDPAMKILATQPSHVLKPEMLTDPNCFYLGMSKEVR